MFPQVVIYILLRFLYYALSNQISKYNYGLNILRRFIILLSFSFTVNEIECNY